MANCVHEYTDNKLMLQIYVKKYVQVKSHVPKSFWNPNIL